jgi:aminopeptidase-like protein
MEQPWGAPLKRESQTEIASYFDRLWPILRSITGDGVRRTHSILSEIADLNIQEVPSGTRCFDWEIPKEWTVHNAYVVTPQGQKILDVHENNLHLVNYSVPFRGKVTRSELDQHLHSLPELPEAVPYVTSYYAPYWGFCIPHEERQALSEGIYQVLIDSVLFDGSLTLSDAILPGRTHQEVLISTYTCHPSMANNELSGPLVSAFLFRRLKQVENRNLTFRFVFVPETIGSIAYLHMHGKQLKERMIAGYVVTCAGRSSRFVYKKSRRGTSLADRAMAVTLHGRQHDVLNFFPSGSDERQYCSPGFNLPVGAFTRGWPGRFREYHTSLDNRSAISFDSMVESVDVLFEVCRLLDENETYEATIPFGEPQFSKYGLMDTIGARRDRAESLMAIKWMVNQADGETDVLTVAERSGLPPALLVEAARACCAAGVLHAKDSSHSQ